MSARVMALLVLGGLAACGSPPPEPPMPEASAVELGDEPAVVGELGGSPFRAADARFRIFTRAGRRRVDLLLASSAIERCGLPLARAQSRVWLRLPERTSLEPGLLESLGEGASFSVHYERPDGLRFVEVHRGLGRLEITRVEARSIEGRMRVCFADAERSCVGGRFTARPCLSRIDGRTLREPPGLADDAIEAASHPEPADASGGARETTEEP